EAEAGAYNHAIVANVLLHLVRASKAQSHQVGSIAAFDVIDVPIEQRILRLELVGVKQIVVDRAQMADENATAMQTELSLVRQRELPRPSPSGCQQSQRPSSLYR